MNKKASNLMMSVFFFNIRLEFMVIYMRTTAGSGGYCFVLIHQFSSAYLASLQATLTVYIGNSY